MQIIIHTLAVYQINKIKILIIIIIIIIIKFLTILFWGIHSDRVNILNKKTNSNKQKIYLKKEIRLKCKKFCKIYLKFQIINNLWKTYRPCKTKILSRKSYLINNIKQTQLISKDSRKKYYRMLITLNWWQIMYIQNIFPTK